METETVSASTNAEPHNRFQFAPQSVYTYAVAKALVIVLLQVGCYVFCITCALLLFSFVVECTGWLHRKAAGVRPKDHQRVQPQPGEVQSSLIRPKSRTRKIRGEAEVKHEPEPSESKICHEDNAVEKSEGAGSSVPEHVPLPVKLPGNTPVSQTYRRRAPRLPTPTPRSQDRPAGRYLDNASPNDGIGIGLGNWVLRIRPPHTILKGTSDEGDVYDGPWEVLKVQEISKVDHTPRPAKYSSRRTVMSAKLRIPKDSLLFKHCEGWVAVDQLVETTPPLGVTNETESVVVEGMQLYVVKKVRGRKLDYPKSPKRSSRNPATPGSSTPLPTKTYLVHWAGYPSEDDSWEKSEKVQKGGVPVTYIKEWKRRENAWERSRRMTC